MRILVYNNQTKRIDKFDRDLDDPMPFTTDHYLKVSEFKSNSTSSVVWSDRRFLETYDRFRRYYGKPIYIGYCFKRIWEGGHGPQSQHYAGGAFDCGQNLDNAGRAELREAAQKFGSWSYVEPASMTPTWVHFDRRLSPPACPGGGYISLSEGSRGVYVLILQDALNAVGTTGSGLDGIFGAKTKDAVTRFQQANGLSADGRVGCSTWRTLAGKAKGIGRTPTVVMP
jgi:hypothetical protein